jgi:putative hydrolase
MKTWKKFQQFLSAGEWHIHTTFTDGSDSIETYCKQAEEMGIPLLAFTEHVRKKPEYDFNQYLTRIDMARENFDLIILSGCEVKILTDGCLDVDDLILSTVDHPIFAYHSFPADDKLLVDSLECVLKDYWIAAWAHPLTWLEKWRTFNSKNDWEWIFELMKYGQVAFELNMKYPLDKYPDFLSLAKKSGVGFVRGSDVHSCNNLCSNLPGINYNTLH